MKMLRTVIKCSALLLGLNASAIYACQLVFASPILAPHFWEEGNQYKGLVVDFLKVIAKKTDCDIEFQAKPWKRVMYETRSGKVDLAMGFHTKQREEFLRYSTAVFNAYDFYIFTRPDIDSVSSIAELYNNSRQLIYPKNWYLGKLKSQILSNENLAMPAVTIKEGINLLVNNRADALLSPTTSALYYFKEMGLTNQFITNSPKLESLAQYLLFSKKSMSDQLYQRLNKTMSEMAASGEVEKIIKSYTHH